MAKVGIVMGSDSDMPIMAKAAEVLEQLGIDYEMTIISAHREPDVFFEYAKGQRQEALRSSLREPEGSTSSGHVRSTFPNAGHWYPNEHLILAVWILCILSCRCQAVSRLRPSLSMVGQMRAFWQPRS